MKRSEASLIGRADVRFHDTSSYEASPRGALNVLGEIDQYFHALAGR